MAGRPARRPHARRQRLRRVARREGRAPQLNTGASVGLSLLGTAAGLYASAALAVAIFGSCPTVYSDAGRGARLEAELFSYSIVPLFEARDLDRLSLRESADGTLRLEVRDEALETHYINHLQLLEVSHAPGEVVLPDQTGTAVTVGGLHGPLTARDRAGANVARALAEADDEAFGTAAATLASARPDDLEDWIDLTFPIPAGAHEAALVLRARSSLLNTVLFYDVMLADAGPRALDWLGQDLERISNAVELGRWVRRNMGLRISVWSDGAYREVSRVPDPGPISWHDVAAVVPVPADEPSMRVRLSFVADAWRIDRVAIADSVRRLTPRSIPVAEVVGPDGARQPAALQSLRAPDHEYLKMTPGQRFSVRFDVGTATTGEERTFLLSSQGYYTEWIRGDWLRAPRPPRVFTPSQATLFDALRRWKEARGSMEARFQKQRVPVL